ncbi:MAG: WG repeat-containing protein [Alistipes sp.]
MLHTLTQYLQTLENPEGLCRQLTGFILCRDQDGVPIYFAGNSAIVFRIQLHGKELRLRCYTHPTAADLEAIYGEHLLRQELFIYNDHLHGTWVDVVVEEWINGITLEEAIRGAVQRNDSAELAHLATQFDTLATHLLSDNWAHGDLKPENIIVDTLSSLQLIDFDALYLPQFAGRESPELGTAAFQHPARSIDDFNASLDDYPSALLSTILHALKLDPTLAKRYPDLDGWLLSPHQIQQGKSAAYDACLSLFATAGEAISYQIATQLRSFSLQIPILAELFAQRQQTTLPSNECPELFIENGLCGYRTANQVIISPRYACGFEFSDNLAAVQIGSAWHFVDLTGQVVINASDYDIIKPFKNGLARVHKQGQWLSMDTKGTVVKKD